jgi:hypothetical protein
VNLAAFHRKEILTNKRLDLKGDCHCSYNNARSSAFVVVAIFTMDVKQFTGAIIKCRAKRSLLVSKSCIFRLDGEAGRTGDSGHKAAIYLYLSHQRELLGVS